MINLLPPSIKEQVAYSKRNRVVVRYFWIAGMVVIVLGVVFAATTMYLNNKLTIAKKDQAARQAEIDGYKSVKDAVAALNSRVATIKNIQSGQAKFSNLLNDLAKSMPAGASLTALSLTGDDKKPVAISATADSYNSAIGLRDTLATSVRVAAADIESISNAKDGYHVEILLSFKPGMAK